MIIERMPGSGLTSALFNGGADAAQAESVCTHLCELIAELHLADAEKLNVGGKLSDPRNVGVDISSWDRYMETTFEYYLQGYHWGDFEPLPVLMDAYLTLRRRLQLSLVRRLQPVNFLYGEARHRISIGRTPALATRARTSRMQAMGVLSNTNIMGSTKEGGFLGYYNKLTGNVTQDEVTTSACSAPPALPCRYEPSSADWKEHMELTPFIISPAS
jgi:hypothetical protein